jgi:hypothetical protein
MHQLSAKLSHLSIALFVLLVSFATDAQSAPPSISSNNRPEAQVCLLLLAVKKNRDIRGVLFLVEGYDGIHDAP